MTQRTFPRASGDGYQANQADWDLMARHFSLSGVHRGKLNDYEAIGDSTGLQVKVKSGHAWVDGHFAMSDAQETLAIATADPTNPRIDRVVLRLDRSVDPATLVLAVVTGTADASPSAPALSRSDTGIWELSLAQVAVAAGASTITAGNVTDERMYSQPQAYTVQVSAVDTSSVSMTNLTGAVITKYFHAGDLACSLAGVITADGASSMLWGVSLDGGSDITTGGYSTSGASLLGPFSGTVIFEDIAEGFHTVQVRWAVIAGGAEAEVNPARLNVVEVPKA